MKKFTKLMLAAAAVAAVSTAMAVSAMADDTVTGTYDATTGVVTLEGVVSSGDQQTLLVLTEDTDVTEENTNIIAQIDQAGMIESFKLPQGLGTGTYYIRMGGTNGTIQTGTLTISGGGGDVETVTIIIGDANLDGSVTALDVGNVLRYSNKYTTRIGHAGEVKVKASDNSNVIIGDANLDGSVTALDVGNVLRYSNKYTTRIGHAGETVEVIK